MLLEIVIFFLGFALIFYCLFGGADFGAGMLELITRKRNRENISDAIGPVWEANHVWLVLIVVILFMGFPKIYAAISRYLHIPIVLLLIGIILRGTAFAFMHYDAIKDRSNRVYNWTFMLSSFITPIFLGIIVGAAILGRIETDPATFYEGFIAPWLNWFTFAVGFFCMFLFTYLASVYMIGETRDFEQRSVFISASKRILVLTVICGGLVFAAAEAAGFSLIAGFLQHPASVAAVILATLLLPLIWLSVTYGKVLASRLLTGAQVCCILIAWFWVQHPVVVAIKGGESLTLYNSAAPDATLLQLVIALIIGSLIILPSLFYLMKVFKGEQFTRY